MALLFEADPSRSARSPVTLFEVPFAAAMDDHDVASLAGALALSTAPRSKGSGRKDNLGFARLDHFSGLFLQRNAVEGQWILRAQTWGRPGPQAIHGWHVAAAMAARRLDPTVNIPDRAPDTARAVQGRHVGRASNRRLSRFRRRLVGVG